MDFTVFYASFGQDFSTDPIPVLSRAAAIGFDGVEISLNDWLLSKGHGYLTELKETAASLELGITCCGGGLSAGCDITSPDETIRRAGIERIKMLLKTAKFLGSSGLDGINYVPWNMTSPPIDRAQRLDMCEKSLKELSRFAEDTGIIYALEIANRYEEFLLNTAGDAIDLCERVCSPNLMIQLDTYHMNIEEDDMYQAIATAGKRLYSLHVSENHRKIPSGQGLIPWNSVARAVKDINFDGHIELEPFLFTGGEIMYSSKIWKNNAAPNEPQWVDRELQKGLNFIKDLFNNERKF